MDYPLCFGTKQEFEAWVLEAEQDVRPEDPRSSFCEYCTHNFQRQMKELGLCQNPDYEIDMESEDIVDGENWNQLSF